MNEDTESRIRKAVAALKAAGAREVYMFGSAARDDSRAASDVDLAVSALPPEVFFRAMGAARRALRQPLDLVGLDEDTPFTRHLREEGELQRVG
jgi:predicted nucleotidyltransferase